MVAQLRLLRFNLLSASTFHDCMKKMVLDWLQCTKPTSRFVHAEPTKSRDTAACVDVWREVGRSFRRTEMSHFHGAEPKLFKHQIGAGKEATTTPIDT